MAEDPCERWSSLLDEEVTADNILELLQPITDDLWVAAACVDRVLDEPNVQRTLLELGLQRTEQAIQRVRDRLNSKSGESSDSEEAQSQPSKRGSLDVYFSTHEDDARLCHIRSVLLERSVRLATYDEIVKMMPKGGLERDSDEDEMEDDPWGNDDGEDEGNAEAGSSALPDDVNVAQCMPLSVFLTEETGTSAMFFASQSLFTAVRIIRERHADEYAPLRFDVLARIPLFADPTEYRELLPGVNMKNGKELLDSSMSSDSQDLSTSVEVVKALKACSFITSDEDGLESPSSQRTLEALSSDDVLAWYRDKVDAILLSTGIVDNALGLVQHGIAHGVLGLDEVGEDLSLISRLVYDGHGEEVDEGRSIGVAKWSLLEPQEIIGIYLERSTPDTIVSDIRKLVKPYLFVLESRAERAGKPDPGISKRFLYDTILNTSLNLVAPIFDSSKPTMVASQRLIADDEDLARLALACLYGSSSTSDWASMSRIFECLPAWNFQTTEDEDEADTTISSLSAFLVPTTARPHTSPSDLIAFFKPLPARSLSRALDILDVHLESGEILSRWGAAVPLRWFLRSSKDETQQRAWAARMARQADAPPGDLQSEDIWLSLLEDMLKLSKPDEDDTNSAFGALSGDKIRKIFFKGILSTGMFDIAKHIVQPRHGERLLPPGVVESLCIEVSHEFYDNAESGNYHTGSMKLAYDCLSVAPQTPLISKERDFIEATSRISSFNVTSAPGLPLLPIEIRLTKDRLSLIQSILRSNPGAYKHTEVLLELVTKLGYRGDLVAEAKTLAMAAVCAMQQKDEERAVGSCERMVGAVGRLRGKSGILGQGGEEGERVTEATNVCWSHCFQVVKHLEAARAVGEGGAEMVSPDRKLTLLARALELCPPAIISDILPLYTSLEFSQLARRKSALSERKAKRAGGSTSETGTDQRGRGRSSLSSKLLHEGLTLGQGMMHSPALPSASALASSTFNRVAAALPFGMHGPSSSSSSSAARSPLSAGGGSGGASGVGGVGGSSWGGRRPGSAMSGRGEDLRERSQSPGGDVSAQARTALRRGVGWLIGAEENELWDDR